MNANKTPTDELAKQQVEAFMELLRERLDLDEVNIKRSADASQKNGKVYVTWAWIIGILLALIAALGARQLSAIDNALETIDRRAVLFEARQADVRERLKVIEELYRRTPEAK